MVEAQQLWAGRQATKAETGAEVYRRGARDLGGDGAGARIEASESAL